jgi:hypothetical protein
MAGGFQRRRRHIQSAGRGAVSLDANMGAGTIDTGDFT